MGQNPLFILFILSINNITIILCREGIFMPKLARQSQQYQYQQQNYGYPRPYPNVVSPIRPKAKPPKSVPIKRKKIVKRKKVNPIATLISFSMLALLGIFVIPFGYERISQPLLFGPNYQEVQVDYYELFKPTWNYLSNDLFLNRRLLTAAKTQKPDMTTLYSGGEMPLVKARLQKLMQQYKTIDPSVFVWEYDSGKFVDINATKIYPAASIIKIPVLIQLFKSIEANQLTIYDEMTLASYFKAEGSGDMQGRSVGSTYTIDQIAREMITKSDNSATNMIISAVGSMTDVNAGIRDWGLKSTRINNWLPDIEGTNYTTAKDLATMLYNLDNPGFLNINSREYIIDYMSHVENNRLIQAGLDKNALFVHKTGDIGKMLGDAGIVFAPNGKKYICVILANRPYNSPQGKDFIQEASHLIYTSIMSGQY